MEYLWTPKQVLFCTIVVNQIYACYYGLINCFGFVLNQSVSQMIYVWLKPIQSILSVSHNIMCCCNKTTLIHALKNNIRITYTSYRTCLTTSWRTYLRIFASVVIKWAVNIKIRFLCTALIWSCLTTTVGQLFAWDLLTCLVMIWWYMCIEKKFEFSIYDSVCLFWSDAMQLTGCYTPKTDLLPVVFCLIFSCAYQYTMSFCILMHNYCAIVTKVLCFSCVITHKLCVRQHVVTSLCGDSYCVMAYRCVMFTCVCMATWWVMSCTSVLYIAVWWLILQTCYV